jgi:hypothetical protein
MCMDQCWHSGLFWFLRFQPADRCLFGFARRGIEVHADAVAFPVQFVQQPFAHDRPIHVNGLAFGSLRPIFETEGTSTGAADELVLYHHAQRRRRIPRRGRRGRYAGAGHRARGARALSRRGGAGHHRDVLAIAFTRAAPAQQRRTHEREENDAGCAHRMCSHRSRPPYFA